MLPQPGDAKKGPISFARAMQGHLDQYVLGADHRHIEQLIRCEALSEAQVKERWDRARELLIEEGNVQHVDAPVTICGLSLIHISEPTRRLMASRMPSSA